MATAFMTNGTQIGLDTSASSSPYYLNNTSEKSSSLVTYASKYKITVSCTNPTWASGQSDWTAILSVGAAPDVNILGNTSYYQVNKKDLFYYNYDSYIEFTIKLIRTHPELKWPAFTITNDVQPEISFTNVNYTKTDYVSWEESTLGANVKIKLPANRFKPFTNLEKIKFKIYFVKGTTRYDTTGSSACITQHYSANIEKDSLSGREWSYEVCSLGTWQKKFVKIPKDVEGWSLHAYSKLIYRKKEKTVSWDGKNYDILNNEQEAYISVDGSDLSIKKWRLIRDITDPENKKIKSVCELTRKAAIKQYPISCLTQIYLKYQSGDNPPSASS